MPTEKKEKIVAGLQGIFAKATVGVMTDYRGLTTAEINDLRHRLRGAGVEYHVVKNSLAQLAARNAGLEQVAAAIKDPTAMAFGYGEAQVVAKVLTEFIRSTKSNMKIKGASCRIGCSARPKSRRWPGCPRVRY